MAVSATVLECTVSCLHPGEIASKKNQAAKQREVATKGVERAGGDKEVKWAEGG